MPHAPVMGMSVSRGIGERRERREGEGAGEGEREEGKDGGDGGGGGAGRGAEGGVMQVREWLAKEGHTHHITSPPQKIQIYTRIFGATS